MTYVPLQYHGTTLKMASLVLVITGRSEESNYESIASDSMYHPLKMAIRRI